MDQTRNEVPDNRIRGRQKLGIYVHIPFCIQKCAYCDFLSAPADEETIEKYVGKLCREIRTFKRRGIRIQEYTVRSIFLGGGTPSILSEKQIGRILETIYAVFPMISREAEITAECNPGTLTPGKLSAMKEAGINRLSIGLQSADNEELRLLGRIHTWEEFRDNFFCARRMGFENINVDLMSAIPGQSSSRWRSTLKAVLALCPEHISAYSLMIEEGTPFYERYHLQDEMRKKGEDPVKAGAAPPLPSEDEERRMYEETEEILSAAGMVRYEISNYALPGYESIHNIGYWRRVPYAGFGLGASSLLGERRIRNRSSLADYLEGNDETAFLPEEVISLTEKDRMEETMFLGLRMMRGVRLADFENAFGKELLQIYEAPVRRLTEQGLIIVGDGAVRLTKRGIDLSNYALAQFLL